MVNACKWFGVAVSWAFAALMWFAVWGTILIGQQAHAAPAPACTPQAGVLFNTCAQLDATQVQNRQAHVPAPATVADAAAVRWADHMATCADYLGRTPGQAFPCRAWALDGTTYTITEPVV